MNRGFPLTSAKHALGTLLCMLVALLLPEGSAGQGRAVPYAIEKEAYVFEHLASYGGFYVTASFTIRNTGASPLGAFRFRFPEHETLPLDSFQAITLGEKIAPGDRRFDVDEDAVILRLVPPVAPKSTRAFSLKYGLIRSGPDHAGLALGPDYFHIATSAWMLRPPAKDTDGTVAKPETLSFEVTAPAGYRVLCTTREGTRLLPAGSRMMVPRAQFPPVCLGGRFHEHRVVRGGRTAVLWLLSDLPVDLVTKAGQHIADCAGLYERVFGPALDQSQPVWLVEMSVGPNFAERNQPPRESAGMAAITGTSGSLRGGVLLSTPMLEIGLGSDAVLNTLAWELAQSWFSYTVEALPDGFRGGLAGYAGLLAEINRRGAAVRPQILAKYLKRYDEVRERAGKDLPLRWASPDDAGEPDWNQRFLLSSRGTFLLVALEDALGSTAMHAALRKLVQDGRGRQVDFDDLRRAVEAQGSKNVEEIFAAWLKAPGIPADFRARHSAP